MPGHDSGDSEDDALAFTRLLASRSGRPVSASGLNLARIFPGVRGQLIRQALGLDRVRSSGSDEDSDDDANEEDIGNMDQTEDIF